MDSPSSGTSKQEYTENNVKNLIELGNKEQYNGNYQGATGNYLQALEFLYQILDDAQTLRDKNSLTSLRATILSKLGDNLIYVGQYKIAVEFYSQQLRIVTNFVNKLDIAFAHHKLGFCHYFIGLYDSSIEFQKKALDILSTEEEKLEFKQLKCKIYLCLGLNQYALKSYEEAANLYQQALDIARRYGLQYEEAEIIANLSSSVRKQLSLESSKFNLSSLENLISDLYYTIRISENNPYIKSLASRELAKTYQTIDIDINFSKKYFENALNIANKYKFTFLSEVQSELNQIIQQEQEILKPDYLLKDQPWYSSVFPKIPEIEPGQLQSSSFQADFVIVTATPIELKAVVRLLEPDVDEGLLPCRVYTSSGQYYLGKFGHYKTVVTQCRMGTRDDRAAGFVTQKALEIWKPKAVIMVGIAFGKSSIDQKIGDVLVATEIIDYDVNRIGLDGITDRGSRPPSNRSLLSLFEQAYEWEFYRPDGSSSSLIPGPVLSGDKLVDNPAFKADLFTRFPHAKGGEMEGIGFCSAANSLDTPWILIKSICDWADGKKSDKHQPLAAAAAASLLLYVLSQRTILNCFG
ncbi:MAG: tetratricopeptide repeat protein [Symploca sp. SIO2C1]|nr:tetratricopeptide repeat protein [Symploca sp. SIO2C1]